MGVTPAVDIYSPGKILYFMLSGNRSDHRVLIVVRPRNGGVGAHGDGDCTGCAARVHPGLPYWLGSAARTGGRHGVATPLAPRPAPHPLDHAAALAPGDAPLMKETLREAVTEREKIRRAGWMNY